MTRNQAGQAPTLAGALSPALREPSDLDVAISVASKMLAAYGDPSRAGFSYPAAYGALSESLRLLLRALGAEPGTRSEGWTSMTNVQLPGPRCPAAHPDDPTPCGGPVAVTVLDRRNGGADGCEWHAARLLASLDGARVYGLPDAPEGAAIRVFKAADGIRPFPWVDGPRTRGDQLSRAETRERGDER